MDRCNYCNEYHHDVIVCDGYIARMKTEEPVDKKEETLTRIKQVCGGLAHGERGSRLNTRNCRGWLNSSDAHFLTKHEFLLNIHAYWGTNEIFKITNNFIRDGLR